MEASGVAGTLSPSRAADFRSCALAYRLRTVDRLPEKPSPAAVRGTVVHRVLERVFDLPQQARTTDAAAAMLPDAWGEVVASWPEAVSMFGPDHTWQEWLASCAEAVDRWFELEDPRRLQPVQREVLVEAVLDSGLVLRGVMDRVDRRHDGAIRVVDYKTGKAPPPERESTARFQMRFYALLWWLSNDVVPTELRLVYLGSGEVLTHRTDADDLRATRVLLERVAEAIATARESGDFEPNPGWQCRYCDFTALCPAYGGTPPPYPSGEPEQPELLEVETGE